MSEISCISKFTTKSTGAAGLARQPHYTHYYVTPDFHGTMLQIIPANVLKCNGQHDNSASSYGAIKV